MYSWSIILDIPFLIKFLQEYIWEKNQFIFRPFVGWNLTCSCRFLLLSAFSLYPSVIRALGLRIRVLSPLVQRTSGKKTNWYLRVRTHDQNFIPIWICNKIVNLLKINVPSCQIHVPPSQIIDPPCQINVPHCQINVPLSNKFPSFLRLNHDPRNIYLQEGHIFVSLFDHA